MLVSPPPPFNPPLLIHFNALVSQDYFFSIAFFLSLKVRLLFFNYKVLYNYKAFVLLLAICCFCCCCRCTANVVIVVDLCELWRIKKNVFVCLFACHIKDLFSCFTPVSAGGIWQHFVKWKKHVCSRFVLLLRFITIWLCLIFNWVNIWIKKIKENKVAETLQITALENK